MPKGALACLFIKCICSGASGLVGVFPACTGYVAQSAICFVCVLLRGFSLDVCVCWGSPLFV